VEPTSLQQWNVSVQHQFGDWLAGVATSETTRAISGERPSSIRRCSALARRETLTSGALILQNATQNQSYDHRSARRHRTGELRRHVASLQRRLRTT
jgi:hypothetical protein